ncbi:MAG: hypothetical protein VB934_04340 [Polyangiaceae bacterium]
MMRLPLKACAVLSLSLLLLACEASEQTSPNPAPLPTASSTGGAGGAPGSGAGGQGAAGGGAKIHRTVETRPLLGSPESNLLIDGDFETSIVVEGQGVQSGWLAFFGNEQRYIRAATGGHCRSGLRCAYLESGVFFYGKGLAASLAAMDGELWAKAPAGRSCLDVAAYVGWCNFAGKLADLVATSETPDETGWCSYRGTVAAQTRGTCMFIENLSQDPAAPPFILDAASVKPTTGERQAVAMTVRRGAIVERFRHASEVARRRRPFGRVPKGPELGRK